MLRGRCRSCNAAISWRYPAVEMATAELIAACVFHFGLTAEAVLAAFFCAVLVVLSAIDIEHRILPDRIVLPSAAIVLVAQTALNPSLEWLLAALQPGDAVLLKASRGVRLEQALETMTANEK